MCRRRPAGTVRRQLPGAYAPNGLPADPSPALFGGAPDPARKCRWLRSTTASVAAEGCSYPPSRQPPPAPAPSKVRRVMIAEFDAPRRGDRRLPSRSPAPGARSAGLNSRAARHGRPRTGRRPPRRTRQYRGRLELIRPILVGDGGGQRRQDDRDRVGTPASRSRSEAGVVSPAERGGDGGTDQPAGFDATASTTAGSGAQRRANPVRRWG